MHRFHLPNAAPPAEWLTLTEGEANHAARVLRLQRGETVTVLNGQGDRFITEVSDVNRSCVQLRVLRIESLPAPPVRIILFQAVTKPRSMDWIVEKSTELGVHCIQPLLTERVVTRLTAAEASRKAEKWRRTAIEALKQCGGAWLPTLEPARSINDALATLAPAQIHLMASLTSEAAPIREAVHSWNRQGTRTEALTVGVWVGPEGDFTSTEQEQLKQAGAIPVTLGPQVLRSETAALCMTILAAQLFD